MWVPLCLEIGLVGKEGNSCECVEHAPTMITRNHRVHVRLAPCRLSREARPRKKRGRARTSAQAPPKLAEPVSPAQFGAEGKTDPDQNDGRQNKDRTSIQTTESVERKEMQRF